MTEVGSRRDFVQADVLDGGPDNRQATLLGGEDVDRTVHSPHQQEEMAQCAGVASSTLSRTFSGQPHIKRDSLLAWGDMLLALCLPEDRELLLAMEAEMLHALGHAIRDDEQRSRERLASYQERVKEILAKRQQGKRKP